MVSATTTRLVRLPKAIQAPTPSRNKRKGRSTTRPHGAGAAGGGPRTELRKIRRRKPECCRAGENDVADDTPLCHHPPAHSSECRQANQGRVDLRPVRQNQCRSE